MDYVLICCRVLIGLVFLMSAAGKLRGRRHFDDFLTAARRLAPGLPARVVAPVVVGAELVVTLSVLRRATAPFGFLVALVLLAAFTVAIGAAVSRGRRVACQCFGSTSQPAGPAHLVRNGVLLLGAAAGLTAALCGAGAADDAGAAVAASLTGAVLAAMTPATDSIALLFRPID